MISWKLERNETGIFRECSKGSELREFIVDVVAEAGRVDDGQSNAHAVLLKL